MKNIENSCIHTLVESQVEQTPNAIAAIFQAEQITYQELNQKANQLAHYLQNLGVKSETLIGVCVDRSLNMLIGILGVLKAGGAYVPLDPSYPADRIALMIEDSQLPVLITQKHLLKNLIQRPNRIVCLDEDWEAISQLSNQNMIGVVSPENLAYTIYTSGSTGKPKGVQILHRGVVNLLLSMQQEPGITSEDVLLALTTFSFDLSVPDLFLPLIVGATQVIVSREVASDANQLAKAIAESGATFIQATPATWRMLLAIGWQGKPDLKIICGGEAMTRTLANQLLERCATLWNMYGPTETTVWSIISKVEPGENVISIGKPILNTQIYLFKYPSLRDSDIMEPVVDGAEGELYIGGMGLARGYLNRPELNEEKFVNAPGKNKPGIRLYKTGDLVRYLTDGTIEFIDRIDEQVKIRGFRIELGEIESALSQHPAVREVAVTTKDDASGHKRIFAYFTSKAPSSEIQPSVKETYHKEVSQWQTIWNNAYSDSSNNPSDPTLNNSGYVNSYTGSLIPPNEIFDWVKHTVERILSLRPQRVLEIGCGTGMLLFRIAPQCSYYLGIDISDYAISYIQQQLFESKKDWSNVTLEQRAAHDIHQFEPESFDTIVINSVIQYFPNFSYLLDVLNKAVKLVKPGGHIFIGDLRSLQFLKAFHASVQLSQAADSLSTVNLRHKINQKIAQEQELLIHPDFFKTLKYQIPQISHTDILLKQGRHENELVKFRFDVIIYVQKEVKLIDKLPSIGWQHHDVTFSVARNLLLNPELEGIKITGVPNVRVIKDLQAFYAIENHRNLTSVKELRQFLEKTNTIENINPEDFYSFAQDFPDYIIHITCSESDSNYDVIFLRKKEPISVLDRAETIESNDFRFWANTPFRIDDRTNLGSQLRAFLQEKLPEYMIPSLFILLDSIPLTPNGKIDRRALPEPGKIRPDLQETYVAPYTPLEKQLATIWSEILGIEQIGIYDSFFELGGHSLLSVHLLTRIQDTLDINLPLFDLFKDPTIAGIVKAIDALQESGDRVPPNNITDIDLQAEIILDAEIRASVPFSASISEPKQIFLTGATGFLGGFLVYELLQQTSAIIYCLVRASSIEEGKERIKSNLERYWLWDHNLSSRIIPVLGNLAQPNLGVTSKTFQFLASSIDVIYHSGAMINLIYPYKSLRACNVLGTQEILRLASQVKPIPINFISTLDVFQSRSYLDGEIVLENDPLECIVDIDRGYALSKWIAEKLILEAKARGIPVTVYRPEMISGQSDTGVVQTNDLLSRFLKGLVQLKAAPDLNLNIHMVPVDYVSQAIVHLSLKSESLGKVFHFVNPSPLPFNNLIHQICELGYSIEQIAYEKWLSLLADLDITHGNALTPLISLLAENKKGKVSYLEESLLNSQVFGSHNTQDGLRDTSIVCPPIDAKLIQTYFSYFTQSGFFDFAT